MNNQLSKTRVLVEGAIMIALGTVLSMIKLFDMPMGGGVTLCAMLPIVLFAYRRGTKWGVFAAFVFSVLQLLLGMDNVQYATSALMAAGIILFDYVVAYTVIGLAGVFKGRFGKPAAEIVAGTVLVMLLRFLCHFLTGWVVWDALWPNEFGLAAPIYSLEYNGSYMLVEAITTSIAAALLVRFADAGRNR